MTEFAVEARPAASPARARRSTARSWTPTVLQKWFCPGRVRGRERVCRRACRRPPPRRRDARAPTGTRLRVRERDLVTLSRTSGSCSTSPSSGRKFGERRGDAAHRDALPTPPAAAPKVRFDPRADHARPRPTSTAPASTPAGPSRAREARGALRDTGADAHAPHRNPRAVARGAPARSAGAREAADPPGRRLSPRERQALPWVEVEKEYVFDTPARAGRTLAELFDGHSQLAHVPLHAPAGGGGGLRELLLDRRRRQPGRTCTSSTTT